MKVVIFTRASRTPARGSSRKGSPAEDVERRPLEEMRRALSDLPPDALVYVDVKGLAEKERIKAITTLARTPQICFGVIDPEGRVKDIAALFHAGAVDYIGKSLGADGLNSKRLAAVAAYAEEEGGAGGEGSADAVTEEGMAGPAGDGWAGVVPGREHRFAFLYIEVDDSEELKKRHEPDNLATAMETFRGFIERIVTQHGGRLWMWSRFGGLALFPLRDGDFPAPLCGLRILLSRIFYDAEESPLPGRLSFRMALSIGSTVYHEKDTGRIVSDGINSIFHLGKRFARPGQFLLSAEAAALVPEPLRPYLLSAGSFEGRRIMRMLQPSPSAGGRE